VSNSIGSIGDHPLDDLAAYALDALDDAERQAVDDHLSRCYACRAELAGHHETLSVLAGDETPPATVWQRIAVGIGADDLPDPHGAGPSTSSAAPAEAVEAVHPETETPSGPEVPPAPPVTSLAEARERRPSRLRWLAAAGSLSAAAAAGAVFGFAMGNSDDGGDDANITALADQASEQLATLQGSGGQPVARVVADEDGAYIVLEGLQNLPEGQAYQLWSLTGPQPVSLGMLGREGNNTVAFRLPPTITNLAISVAPTSGDTSPTGPFEASGQINRS
jgi:anti-sigma factor RsiW